MNDKNTAHTPKATVDLPKATRWDGKYHQNLQCQSHMEISTLTISFTDILSTECAAREVSDNLTSCLYYPHSAAQVERRIIITQPSVMQSLHRVLEDKSKNAQLSQNLGVKNHVNLFKTSSPSDQALLLDISIHLTTSVSSRLVT